ncbi:MAG: restriction endonuclease subunit S [Bacteroidota bacterium]|jgi:type I restriction enzyme S subunit
MSKTEFLLSEVSNIISVKAPISEASLDNYISTENMLPDFGGVIKAEKLPVANSVNTFLNGDILFSNIRTYFKKVWSSKFNGTVSPDVLVFRANENKCTNKYLYYTLCNPEFIELSILTSKGAKMPRGDKDAMLKYTFSLPSLPEQHAIAEVLSCLDDKIDLLHRNNKTLEEMAETLFRQWFVEGAKEDWEVKTLGTLVSTIVDNRGKTPPTVEFNTGMPLIEVNALNSKSCCVNYSVIRKFVTEETYNSWFRKHLAVKDIIFSTVGSIGIFSLLMKQEGVIAQNVVGLRCSSPFFFYLWLKSNVEVILSLDIGGVQPSIKLPHLLGLEAKVPADSMLNKFENQVEHIFQKIRMNEEQIASLTILRDTLLPKLMSGQVRVNH